MRSDVRASIHPTGPAEEEACARIALAMWCVEQVDRLEAAFWNRGAHLAGPGPSHLIRAFGAASRTCSLDTIMRYHAAAARGLAAALRHLTRLRAPHRTNEPDAGAAHERIRRAVCTNEPDSAPFRKSSVGPASEATIAHRSTNEPEPPPRLLNRHQRRRLAARRRCPSRRAA